MRATLLAVALVCSSCAGDRALIVSGETLDALGNQFADTAAAMNAAKLKGSISPDAYASWKAFGQKFQLAWPLAKNLWQVAADSNDEKLQQAAVNAIRQLAADLALYQALILSAPTSPDGGP